MRVVGITTSLTCWLRCYGCRATTVCGTSFGWLFQGCWGERPSKAGAAYFVKLSSLLGHQIQCNRLAASMSHGVARCPARAPSADSSPPGGWPRRWASSYHRRARSGRRVSLLITWFVHGLTIPLAHLVAAVVNKPLLQLVPDSSLQGLHTHAVWLHRSRSTAPQP